MLIMAEWKASRKRAEQNRQAGYVLGSTNHPKKSKYYGKEEDKNA